MANINIEWVLTLKKLIDSQLIAHPRGFTIYERLNYHTCVDMHYPILMVPERKLGYKFMCREAWWIMDGRNTVDTITDYSKAIKTFSNDGFNFDGAYGPRVVDQLRYIVDMLEKDRDTRQAVLTIWRPNPRDSKDIPCTVAIQWLIRENRIYCIDTMRSSDIWLGWPYDIFNFTMLTGYIMLLLRERGIDNLILGDICLNAGSQHLYNEHYYKALDIVNNKLQYKTSNLEFDPYKFKGPLEFKNYLKLLSENNWEEIDKHYDYQFGRELFC